MSTIATPRDPYASLRRTASSQAIATPTSSARPSLDIPRSATSSPVPGSSPFPPKRNNRAALREYYNLKKSSAAATPPLLEVTDADSAAGDAAGGELSHSDVPPSEMDAPAFDADAYVRARLADSTLEELLKTYTRVLGEIRALDAEKKALVYDNYSKLITATETIRKMQANMDPLNPMASTLDPAIAHIYSQASSIRDTLRQSAPKPEESERREEEQARKRRTRELVAEVLQTPARMRTLMQDGKVEEAREAWRLPKELLLTWKEKRIGGTDVDACLADGEAALKG
ncbi:hypothetical protein VSDG_03478 [Cytospora chrysosperma]|uniref:Vacuolar protein sorting-associated protein 51 homolog n=1 Tax=Cytospora chrysosperma TaxID=252740 RepID=A0A423WA82_CYTCH|nr:hypothetical protein VSDG_03478 [Valsa sordida]